MSDIKNEIYQQFITHWKKVGYDKDDYDGYGAKGVQIPSKLIEFASKYYLKLREAIKIRGKNLPLPFLGPYDEENTIIMEWNSKTSNLSIIINEKETVLIFISINMCEDFTFENALDVIDPICIEKILEIIETID